jgi:lipopolysaccharide/colanic/teichoic acid biosynthesis glycosyltransferase
MTNATAVELNTYLPTVTIREIIRRYERDNGVVSGLVRRMQWRWQVVRGELCRILKRQFDLLASLFLMLLFSPIILVAAAAIKMTDGGAIFHRHLRVGESGRTFWFPKFRSMVPNAEAMLGSVMTDNHHGDSITFKIKRDPRVTSVGRFLRRFSLDELPQLWCVFRGDMSLVGPRPALPHEVANYRQCERRRLEAAPGLTCIWQVTGRADVPFDLQVAMDVDYIERQSLMLDLKLLILTIPAVLTGRGAY